MISIANSVRDLINQNLDKKHFFKMASKTLNEPVILQFDCRGQKFAIRNEGKNKYVQDFSNGKKEFYDLVKDPLMEKNIIDIVPHSELSFYENNLYDFFINKLSSNNEELPMAGYCPYQIRLK